MKLLDALNQSNCGIAECYSPLMKNILVARAHGPKGPFGYKDARVISSCTDPTVVRRLRINEIENTYWVPWDSTL
jgi:hypothetical protein